MSFMYMIAKHVASRMKEEEKKISSRISPKPSEREVIAHRMTLRETRQEALQLHKKRQDREVIAHRMALRETRQKALQRHKERNHT
jgi:phosphopantetheinyl transferase (holo-ACP synthase)